MEPSQKRRNLVHPRDLESSEWSPHATSAYSLETPSRDTRSGKKRRTWNRTQLDIIEKIKVKGLQDKYLCQLCLEEPHILGDRQKVTAEELRSMRNTIRRKLQRLNKDKEKVR